MRGGVCMSLDYFEGKWEQARGLIQQKWGKLTKNDMDIINGDIKMLMGKIQEKYGISEKDVKKALKDMGF